MYIHCIHMNTTIQQWGNSLAVRLPKEITQKCALHAGSRVVLTTERGRVVISPAPTTEGKVELATLLRRITSKNRHIEQDWGASQGNEVW